MLQAKCAPLSDANKSAPPAEMNGAAPLTEAESAALLAPLSAYNHILIAVSGGPDSMALMGLCAAWSAARGGVPRVSVASVDHGFRPEARGEAEFVCDEAAKLGLDSIVLTRSGAVPDSGLQEAAREARYDLLYAHARAIGAQALVTAHHADDQAETVLMRLCRGSGPGGLAGMRTDTPRGAVVLMRPFLSVPRARIAATLAGLGLPSIDDPSNADLRFERVRLRQLAGTLAELGLSRERLLLLGQRAARADAALDRAAEMAWAKHRLAAEPELSFGSGLFGEPREILLRVLAKGLAQRVAGRQIRLERLEDLGEALSLARAQNQPLVRTLGGVLVRLDEVGRVSLTPEGPRRA